MTNLQELEDLLPDYQYVDGERIVLTVGLLATFYFWDGHKASVRSALVECIEAYQSNYGSNLTWAFDAEAAKPVPIEKMAPVRKLVAEMDADDMLEWFAASGDFDSATEYRISAMTERGWQENQASMVSFVLPRDHAYIPEKREKLFGLVKMFAEKLSPFHGHVGLGAVSVHQQYRYQSDELDVATRYRGLFIEDVFHGNWAYSGLTSIDWLTYVGQPLAERVGGMRELGNRLRKAGANVTELSRGLFVAYGAEPDIGVMHEDIPPLVSAVNGVLRPLRIGNVESMGFGSVNGELRFNRYTSDLWTRRYDAPYIWPPASFIGLPERALIKPRTPSLKLKTGEICAIAGRYQYIAKPDPDQDEDFIPMVVLLPGDIAPYWVELGPHGEYLGRAEITWSLIAEF